jgi:hypothetical protein
LDRRINGIDDDKKINELGTFVGIRILKGNPSTGRNPAPVTIWVETKLAYKFQVPFSPYH